MQKLLKIKKFMHLSAETLDLLKTLCYNFNGRRKVEI